MGKPLNVKKTTLSEVVRKWGFTPVLLIGEKDIYIRCNSKGEINWESAPIYTSRELIQKNNVKIL